jgi:hypothetical protein
MAALVYSSYIHIYEYMLVMFCQIVASSHQPGLMRAEQITAWTRAQLRDDQFPLLKTEMEMNVDKAVLSFAGTMVLISAALAWLVGPVWLLLTVFVGLNMLQAGITGFCPAAMIFRRLGLPPGVAFR